MKPTTITITGTETNQFTINTSSLSPFSEVVVADSNPGQTETVTVTLSASGHGALSNLQNGSYDSATGVYTVTGTTSEVTAALDGLVFTPTVADQAIRTTFAIKVVDSAGNTASNNTTAVIAAHTIAIATNGATTLASLGNQNSSAYLVENISGSVVAYLTLNGSPVLVNQFPAGWAPVGAIQTGNGYEVAWESTAGTYVVWNINSNGAFTGNATGVLSSTSPELEGVEANFGELGANHKFPGGGPAATPSTSGFGTNGQLAELEVGAVSQNGDAYELNPGTGPLLELNGVIVTKGQLGGWTPIGAVQAGDGYEVAWSEIGASGTQFVIWNVNSNGDYTSEATGVVSAGSPTIEAVEGAFGETLTGAGPAATPSTSGFGANGQLAAVGNLFELIPTGATTGPLLELNGSAVVAGQLGSWTPVGALQTGDGYEVAFSNAGGTQFVVWNVNSSGDYTSEVTGPAPADSATIEAVEGAFGETFTGAGPATTPTTNGFGTNGQLAGVGNLFELIPTGATTGPLLELNGSAVTQFQFGLHGWRPVGAIQTATGYEVAFGEPAGLVPGQPGQTQYVVWNTDSNGDYTGNATGILSSTSYQLEELELTFNEDLNGDGTTGPTTTAIPIGGNGVLDAVANQFELTGGTAPFLQLNGSVVVAGQLGSWTPVGALQTGNGYEVAFSNGANQYVVWNTDSNGDYTSNATGVLAGNSLELEGVEAAFGDGTFSGGASAPASATPIVSNTATTLAELEVGGVSQNGDAYELNPHGGTGGPLLELNGGAVTKGQFAAGWTPVGALQTGNGYEVAFGNGANQYVVWNTDSNGDYTSSATGVLAGNSLELEGVEAAFGDGTFSGGASAPASAIPIVSNTVTTLAELEVGGVSQNGDAYELNPNGGNGGPLLELNGSAVTKGQFGAAGWTPVGVLQTGDGYEVAFGNGANQYVVWNTDSNGDYTGNATGVLAGNSLELEGVEAAFGDGTFSGGASASATATPITINGTNNGQLDAVGGLYELNPSGGGPLLELDGSAVVAGQLGSWTPIGAVENPTTGGYEVAWSLLAGGQPTDQYTVWNTDSNGDYTSSAIGVVSGQNFTLEDLNPVFGENLNGALSLSAILKTTTAPNGTLNLSGQTQNATVDLGANSASASGMNGANTTINGTPDAITLNSSAHEIVEYGLAPSSGVETLTNFVFGQDQLNIALRGTPNTALQFHETMVGGAPAVSIFSSGDPAHGLLLLGLPSGDNAAFVQSRVTLAGGASGQSHVLIS